MHPLEEQLVTRWPPAGWSRVTVVVAVSGGADSMALLRSSLATRHPGPGRLVVAHFNHRLRGSASDEDESFVREQAQKLSCEYIVDRAVRVRSAGHGFSEAAARAERYEFLRQSAQTLGARFLATAHTADDQAETILHRIVRGTGLPGLAGIPSNREIVPGIALVRPLLDVTRAEVERYLAAIGQPFRVDSSNSDPQFTRNRLRHELLPQLERDYHPQVRESLIRLGQLARDASAILTGLAGKLSERAVRCGTRQVDVDCTQLKDSHPYLVCQMFMEVWREKNWGQGEMTLEHWRQLAELAAAPRGESHTLTFPGSIRAVREGERIVLTPCRSTSAECGPA